VLLAFSCQGRKADMDGIALDQTQTEADIVEVIKAEDDPEEAIKAEKEKNANNHEIVNNISDSEDINIVNQEIEIPIQKGLIIENNLRIRNNPNTESEILDILNFGALTDILEVTDKIYSIGNHDNHWYKIKTENNIIGWVFGKYITSVQNDIKSFIPEEFSGKEWEGERGYSDWREYKGSIEADEIITKKELINVSWHKFFIFLQFSEEGHYAIGDRWSGSNFGYYFLEDNCVYLYPPITVNRFDEYFDISKLYYSNDNYYEGSPVLRNSDETVVFYPNQEIAHKPKTGDIVKRDGYYCSIISERTNIKINNILYALPDKNAKNLFSNNYYGNKVTEAGVIKCAESYINGELWYYTFIDFTDDDPIDAGGPYYYGWLPQDVFE
jgi:hypothetical protein